MVNKKGWSFLYNDFKAVVNYRDEFLYFIKRYLIDIIAFIPFIISLIYIFFSNQKKEKKILLGTVPIITFESLSKLLNKNNIDNTLFVFKDWSDGNFHSGLSFEDICKNKFLNKNPYGFGSYIAFIWALKNFDIFCLYFNSGFLERTIFWKIEPIIYQIFNKKTILIPYGSDVWSASDTYNPMHKIGIISNLKKHFLLDNKRKKRIFHWSKYVNVIIGFIDYYNYLPRIDILVYHGQIFVDIDKYKYNFNHTKIKIIHYANDKSRKGSMYIEKKLQNIDAKIKYFYGVKREFLLKELDNSHFYIEQLTNGFINYSTLEAMLKGKIVFAYIDENINNIYKLLNSEYYIPFFEELPIVNVNLENIEDKIVEYLNKDFDELEQLSKKSREFAVKLIKENEQIYIDIFKKLKENI